MTDKEKVSYLADAMVVMLKRLELSYGGKDSHEFQMAVITGRQALEKVNK
jgi:hypothetical protein